MNSDKTDNIAKWAEEYDRTHSPKLTRFEQLRKEQKELEEALAKEGLVLSRPNFKNMSKKFSYYK
jgi:hypothetical protein